MINLLLVILFIILLIFVGSGLVVGIINLFRNKLSLGMKLIVFVILSLFIISFIILITLASEPFLTLICRLQDVSVSLAR